MIDRPAEKLTSFLNFITDAQSHYKFCLEEMKKQEQLTQDYLHSLELDNLEDIIRIELKNWNLLLIFCPSHKIKKRLISCSKF